MHGSTALAPPHTPQQIPLTYPSAFPHHTLITALAKRLGCSIHRIKAATKALRIKTPLTDTAIEAKKLDEMRLIPDAKIDEIHQWVNNGENEIALLTIAMENHTITNRVKKTLTALNIPTRKSGSNTYIKQKHLPQIEAHLNRPRAYKFDQSNQAPTLDMLDKIAQRIHNHELPPNSLAIIRAYTQTDPEGNTYSIVSLYLAGEAIRKAKKLAKKNICIKKHGDNQ